MNYTEKILRARISRRGLFMGAGALGLGATLAQTGLVPLRSGVTPGLGSLSQSASAQMEMETIQDILNVTVTVEAFGVTFLGAGIDSAQQGNFDPPIPDDVLAIVIAARAQEQFHLDFFQSLGGQMLVDTFTLPDPALLTDPNLFFGAVEAEETREIAAQIAAFETFTAMDRPDLVKVSFQYAAEEAEHRLLANYARGMRPANNLAFAPALYSTAGEILMELREVGIIGGTGPAVTYPGPGTIDATNVTNTEPDGPEVMCSVDPGMPTDPDDGKDDCQPFEETGLNVCGTFLDFWSRNGGLAVFGYPLTEETPEENFDTGEIYRTQYFERQRFELHPENAGTPYEVLLGRLGVEILEIQGRDWQTFPKADPGAMHYFEETGHAIAPEFWEYWSSHGLDYGDSDVSFRESLLLFGYPISEPMTETNMDDDTVLTQWFERAVFELHPDNPEESRVLLRRLGAEFLEARS